MIKVDSSFLVCTAAQALALLKLGIAPAACMCYEYYSEEDEHWQFAGEWGGGELEGPEPGTPGEIPAWTLEELHVLIGGDFGKPDLYGASDWTYQANMMQWILCLPKKRREFISGAQAAAVLLEHLLGAKLITAADANARMAAFIDKKNFNPMSEKLDQKNKEQ